MPDTFLQEYKTKALLIWPELSKKHIWKRLTVRVCELENAAGLAHVSGLVQINSSYSAAIMKEILGHEICHIVTMAIYGCCKDHGK